MLRNIDVIKEIKELIIHFNIDVEKLEDILKFEQLNFDEVIEEEYEECIDVIEDIRDIGESLEKLTEDIRESIELECFDFDSFRWCLDKVNDNEMELVNYMESFGNAIDSLEPIVDMILRNYKVLTQYAYSGDETENNQEGTE